MSSNIPVVLISGASSGFGKETADLLHRRGWWVFGTSRTPDQAGQSDWTTLELDVRQDDSVRRCVDEVQERAGQIDVLVNNAGYVLNGFAEEATAKQVEEIFQTNESKGTLCPLSGKKKI